MDAPPSGALYCVGCDLAPKVEVDTDFEAAESGPSPASDKQGQGIEPADSEPCSDIQGCIEAADSEPFFRIQGQYGMGSRRRSPRTRTQCLTGKGAVALV
jgi:hypothetical protein